VICPKCGEDNSDNFRFCGMCGTVLEARRPAGTPVLKPPSTVSPRTMTAPEPLPPNVAEHASNAPNEQAPPISGPSMLGLDRSGASRPNTNQPSADILPDNSFSGFNLFLEPERPKTGGRRILLLVVLLAALGGAGWWTYTNYLGVTGSQKPAAQEAPPTDTGSSPAAAPSSAVPEGPSANASVGPDSSRKAGGAEAQPVPLDKTEDKPLTPAPVTPPAAPPKVAPQDKMKMAAKHAPSPSLRQTPKVAATAAADTGDGDFRKGEAALYGRGVPENCDQAMKYLKAASAKSNAKARSAFGTMYATGHCVARDLPTSYVWFKMALQVDPNNQILEKDLTAVWNQMTPPERQMATRK